ncbi:McrB family protein [Capnocytophaga canimorsus]|uniref:McrB family protein n=1 Tax=Capnocytophaga canimorsus TaxID=28188 RepID=UPI0037CF85B7
MSYQQIFFGTPGSGKSHIVKEFTEGKKMHRTTFHPDSDYASFVGCYKPTMEESEIKYSFTPQVFTEAYIDAWKNLEEDVYLVIEEINRGNCAQIFGDLFQLLDRNENGYSDYRIKADSDLRDYLYSQLGEGNEGIKGGELCLPPNLRILATMNTSDQSLFPMDSAFKRRWDWEYVPVDYSDSVPSSRFIITLGDKQYRWIDFLQKVNEKILGTTESEDKQMGNFFIKANVSETEFKSKVMFYLWNEVCRNEYGTNNPKNFFRTSKEAEFSFNELYKSDGLEKLHGFMMYLGIPLLSAIEDAEEVVEQPEQA